MLVLQSLFRSYRGIPAVQDVSFTVSSGEIVGFLGPNGAGKSTTVKMITGMLRPNDGHVLFHGQDIRKDMVAFRSAIGYVPEEAHLYNYLSALEYLQLVGRLRGLDEALIESKAAELLRLLDLESWQHSPISSYSKGMRQRVLIAAVLLHSTWFPQDCSRICWNCWPHEARQFFISRTCSKWSNRSATVSS
jgi:ABC-2 type transport system ATP-binding protein